MIEFDAATCERLFFAALVAHDMQGVVAALRVLAVRDPRRAATLYSSLQLGLTIARAVDPPELTS